MPRANYFDVIAKRDPNAVPKRKPNSKENKGQVDASDQSFADLIASLGMAPRPGPQAGVPRDSNSPIGSTPPIVVQPRDINVAPQQSGPRWANGISPTYQPGMPRDGSTGASGSFAGGVNPPPRVPLTALYPKDPNAAQPPRVPPDRTPDPAYYQKTADVTNALIDNPALVNALTPTGGSGYATTNMNAQPVPNDPRLSANRAPNLAMLYKDPNANPTSGGTTPPKKQWTVPKGSQIPDGYEVVGEDGKGGVVVQKKDGAKSDPKAEQQMNNAYLSAGTSVASAAAYPIYQALTAEAAPTVATTGTTTAGSVGTAGSTATAGTAGATSALGATTASAGTATGVAAGGQVAAGAGSSAAAGAGAGAGNAAAGAGSTTASTLGAVAPYLWVLYAIYRGYEKQKGLEKGHKKVGGKLTDDEIDAIAAPPGKHFFDQPARAIFGKEGQNDLEKFSAGHTIMQKIYGSTKHEDQLKRDRMRRALQKGGLVDENYNIVLPDGTAYQIGVEDKIEGTNLHPYDVDLSNAEAQDVVGLMDPMASIMTDADKKMRRDMAGFFTNAVMSSPNDKMANVRGVYEKAGLTRDTARAEVTKQFDDGKIDEGRRDAYYASLDRIFGVGAPAETSAPASSGGGSAPKPKETSAPASAPKPAPTLSSIIPQNPPPQQMPEPDDEKTPEEQQAVNDYIAILNGRIGNAREQRKGKEKYQWKTSSKRS